MVPLLANVTLYHREIGVVRLLAKAIDRNPPRLKDPCRRKVIEAPEVILLFDLGEAFVLGKRVDSDH